MKRIIRASIDIPSLPLKNMNKEARSFEHFVELCEEYRRIIKKYDGEDYSPLDPEEYRSVYISAPKNSWPVELTYEKYGTDEPDQYLDALFKACDKLGLEEETAARGGYGIEFFYDDEGNDVGHVDLDDQRYEFDLMWDESTSKHDFEVKVLEWLKDLCDM